MDQARSTISKIFNGEPHSYTRFNLTQNMEGDNSHVEMKLSTDVDEEVGGNGVGEHLNHNANRNSSRKPYLTQTFGRTPKNLCFLAATVFLIFIIGYLIGYMVHQKKDVAPVCAASFLSSENTVAHETGAAPLMNWDDVKALLSRGLTANKMETALSEFSIVDHRAGSYGDEQLGNKVHERFKSYRMKTWTDEHFVKVQDLPASGSNSIVFKNNPEERPKGFLSYSGTGSVTGAVLYGHYGQESDFRLLRDRNINLSGRVMLLRAGKISFAEKVANAVKMNASAVLIYPDHTDYSIGEDTDLYGHVHLGSGDPYTPGFPSFNHTQFPPVQSSGLPQILAQTITQGMAIKILRNLGGQNLPEGWDGFNKLGDVNDTVTVKVNNVLAEKKINNVFGVIKGFVDSDRYVVIGAQRDAWGPGYAASTVGTSVLVELARSISDMVKNDGFKPRRSIVFASWSAGEYGSVGATEWLEGYLTSLGMKAFSYINLDGIVTGWNGFKVAASPLMHTLIKNALKEVKNKDGSLFDQFAKNNWESEMLEPMNMDNAAYPFLAFSGIPSMSFRFKAGNLFYKYFGTMLDTKDKLNAATSTQVPQLAETAGRFAGHIALRLVHDHLLQMDLKKYDNVIRSHVVKIKGKVNNVQQMQPQLFPKALTVNWLIMASGSFGRAHRSLMADIDNSDLEDIEMCRLINDRIMTVERSFLSPYVSPRESPFRHILLGSGPHTLKALYNHLDALKMNTPDADANLFRNQFALATWTIQGSANALAGDIWSLDNEI
ncbi:transferrin receptor protein 1-like [Melanotaenia boesemani]|uniref:transferrin receptor protein 1-like n=1 Tax=Melanotaenia boesemani TaxID=1250792 RepID=UPI001C041894|nr:transferrin receptor protein 1-like [Melanotaenia boesemani]